MDRCPNPKCQYCEDYMKQFFVKPDNFPKDAEKVIKDGLQDSYTQAGYIRVIDYSVYEEMKDEIADLKHRMMRLESKLSE